MIDYPFESTPGDWTCATWAWPTQVCAHTPSFLGHDRHTCPKRRGSLCEPASKLILVNTDKVISRRKQMNISFRKQDKHGDKRVHECSQMRQNDEGSGNCNGNTFQKNRIRQIREM